VRCASPSTKKSSRSSSARCSTGETPLADGVQRALGREPRDFSEFAREAAAGVWDV
jgi:hypothetical protein